MASDALPPRNRWSITSSSSITGRFRDRAAATSATSCGRDSCAARRVRRASAASSSSTGAISSDGSVACACASASQARSRPCQRAGSRACTLAHHAHSLSSVPVNSWSIGAAIASDTPRECGRATAWGKSPASGGQHSAARPRATRACQSASSAASASMTSSTAPVVPKKRLGPVSRRDPSKGSNIASPTGTDGPPRLSLRRRARRECRARRESGPRG